MREQAIFLDDLTRTVAENWYDLPYTDRLAIRHLAEKLQLGTGLQKLPSRGVREIVEGAVSPLWEWVMGDNSTYQFGVALGKFLSIVAQRAASDDEANLFAWKELTRDAPEFAKALRRPVPDNVDWVALPALAKKSLLSEYSETNTIA